MVDVVTNHMAYKGCETCVNYSVFNPFNEVSIITSLHMLSKLTQTRNHIITNPTALLTTTTLALTMIAGGVTRSFPYLIFALKTPQLHLCGILGSKSS